MESSEIKSYEQKMKKLEKQVEKFETELRDAKSKLSKLSGQQAKEQEKLQEAQKQFEKSAEQHLRERIRKERTDKTSISEATLEDNKETDNIINIIIKARIECRSECERIDLESKETQALIKNLESQIEETWELWSEYFYKVYPDKPFSNKNYTYTDSYSSSDIYSFDSMIGDSYNSSFQNDSLEETLRRDREARWKHDQEEERRQREYERRQKEEQDRKDRHNQMLAHKAQMRKELEDRRQQERGLRHQCNTCSLSAKCYMRGSYPCPTYRPR